jgi:hypothetical protein
MEKIEARAHPIDMSAPQRCIYCASGLYRSQLAPDTTTLQTTQELAGFGLGGVGCGLGDWLVFVCETCGNVQLFRPDRTKYPQIWKRNSTPSN